MDLLYRTKKKVRLQTYRASSPRSCLCNYIIGDLESAILEVYDVHPFPHIADLQGQDNSSHLLISESEFTIEPPA